MEDGSEITFDRPWEINSQNNRVDQVGVENKFVTVNRSCAEDSKFGLLMLYGRQRVMENDDMRNRSIFSGTIHDELENFGRVLKED